MIRTLLNLCNILGEAVIKDVEKLGENVPLKAEKEEERIQDVSVDEFEVEDSIMEQVNGDASKVEKEKKSNGVEPDLTENKSAEEQAVSKESKPYNGDTGADENTSESLKREVTKKSESDSLNSIQEKES